jgi:hypothetical protein
LAGEEGRGNVRQLLGQGEERSLTQTNVSRANQVNNYMISGRKSVLRKTSATISTSATKDWQKNLRISTTP